MITQDNLNELMDFGHVIQVHADGTVTEPTDVYCGETITLIADPHGGVDDPTQGEVDLFLGKGWRLLNGWTGQDRYHGSVMHPSEYIGGGLARHILETPGYYCAVIIDCLPEDEEDEPETENVGWAVAYRE